MFLNPDHAACIAPHVRPACPLTCSLSQIAIAITKWLGVSDGRGAYRAISSNGRDDQARKHLVSSCFRWPLPQTLAGKRSLQRLRNCRISSLARLQSRQYVLVLRPEGEKRSCPACDIIFQRAFDSAHWQWTRTRQKGLDAAFGNLMSAHRLFVEQAELRFVNPPLCAPIGFDRSRSE